MCLSYKSDQKTDIFMYLELHGMQHLAAGHVGPCSDFDTHCCTCGTSGVLPSALVHGNILVIGFVQASQAHLSDGLSLIPLNRTAW